MVILTLLAYGLWKERQKEEAAKKDHEVSDILDNLESSGEEEEKDAEIEDIEKALAELKESELGNGSPEKTAPTTRRTDIFDDNTKDDRNVDSEGVALHPPPGEAFSETRKKSLSRSITGSSTTKPASRSRTRSRSRGPSRVRERSRGNKKSGERRAGGNIADRSKIEMVKLKIEKRIRREEDEKRMRREEERRRMREEEEFRHTNHHHHNPDSHHHHRHFTNPDHHYPRYEDDEYYGPPGPPPFHGDYGPVSPPYPRQHGKAGGGGYCQERPGGYQEKGYLEKSFHEKGFHSKPFYPPPLPPPIHMHYQRFPPQHY